VRLQFAATPEFTGRGAFSLEELRKGRRRNAGGPASSPMRGPLTVLAAAVCGDRLAAP